MAPRRTLKEALRILGTKTTASESKPGPNRLTSLSSLALAQRQREAAVNESTRLSKSTYEGRATSERSGAHPNYQGPMGYAGSGTEDRMPGTTTRKKNKNRGFT